MLAKFWQLSSQLAVQNYRWRADMPDFNIMLYLNKVPYTIAHMKMN